MAKKTKRQQVKHSALSKKYTLKTRRDYCDFDYINGVYVDSTEVIRPLNDGEKDWLNKFYEEVVHASFKHEDTLNDTVEKQRGIYSENNSRNACIFNILKTHNMLYFNDHKKLHELYDRYNYLDVIEEEVLNSPLNYIGNNTYIEMVEKIDEFKRLQTEFVEKKTIQAKNSLNKFFKDLNAVTQFQNGWYLIGDEKDAHIMIRYTTNKKKHNIKGWPAEIWWDSEGNIVYVAWYSKGKFKSDCEFSKPTKKTTDSIN